MFNHTRVGNILVLKIFNIRVKNILQVKQLSVWFRDAALSDF